MKILGILYLCTQNRYKHVLSQTYRRANRIEIEVVWSYSRGRAKVLRKDNNVYALSKEFREIEHETGHRHGTNESESRS